MCKIKFNVILNRNGKAKIVALLLVFVIGTSVSGYFYFFIDSETREIPRIDLSELDPAISKTIEKTIQNIEADPANGENWGELGLKYYAHNYGTKAIEAFAIAAEISKDDPRWPYLHGMVLCEADVEAGLPFIEKSLSLAPTDIEIRTRYAEFLFDLRRLDQAEKEFKTAIREKSHPRLQLGLARIYFRKNDLEKALKYAKLAHESAPDHRDPLELLVRIYQKQKETENATKTLGKLEKAFVSGWPDSIVGKVDDLRMDSTRIGDKVGNMISQGRTSEALVLLKKQIKAEPDNPFWLLMYLQQQVEKGNHKTAISAAKEFDAAKFKSAEIDFLIGRANFELGEFESSTKILQSVVDRKPDFANAHLYLGKSLRESNPKKSLEHLEVVLKLDPESLEANLELAEAFLSKGEKERALEYLKRAKLIEPKSKRLSMLEEMASK